MDVFEAVAQPTRRSIVEMLASSGQLTASEIAARFKVTQPAISQHLKILREAGLVRMKKHHQQRIYEVNPEAVRQLESWAGQMSALWEQRLDALERLVQAEDTEGRTTRGRKERNRDKAK